MSDSQRPVPFVFPKWANYVLPAVLVVVLAGLPYQALLVGFALNPTTLNVGYQPVQPVAYSHDLHVTQLGMDCRYCHTTVEKAGFAAIPPTATCINCHATIQEGSRGEPSRVEIAKLRERFFKEDAATHTPNAHAGEPVEWIKVHDLPDYVYFNHSAHVNAGVSCVVCHGRIDRIGREGVWQQQPLSMGWCLDCHRDPSKNLRPADQVTNLMWGIKLTEDQVAQIKAMGVNDVQVGTSLTDAQRQAIGDSIKQTKKIKDRRQMSDCSTCHR